MEKKQKLPDSQCVVIIHSNEQDAESVKKKLEKIPWIKSVFFERWIFRPKS